MGEKNVVDPVDPGPLQPFDQAGDGGRRARIDEDRRPADPAEPCADELPEPFEGLVDVDQTEVVSNLPDGHGHPSCDRLARV